MTLRPLINLDEICEFDDVEDNGLYVSRRAFISERIGAQKLGYNLTIVPPGKVQCPFHSHHAEEEMFLILSGTGELRFGDCRFNLRQHDIIACPTGGADVAHQIINTGSCDLVYLAVSTIADVEICEYPDSNKISAVAGKPGERIVRSIFRSGDSVDYYDGETGAVDG